MNGSNMQMVGWTAIAGGVIGVIGFISLALLFTIGEPFGTINDLLAIPSSLLLLPLVFALYRLSLDHPIVSLFATLAGLVGFVATAVGSVLLVTRQISFEQSLITGIGGFGLVGLWVLLTSTIALRTHALPAGMAWTGLALGLTPALALLVVPRAEAIARTLEGMAGQSAGFQMSPLLMIVFALGVLSYAGLPFWFIWIGRLFTSGRLVTQASAMLAP